MTDRLRRLWRSTLRRLAAPLLHASVWLYPDGINSYILEKTAEATMQALKAHLRRRGERFCEVCTSTMRPLRRVGDVAACPEHVQQLLAREEKIKAAA